jgi:hypothetical protein
MQDGSTFQTLCTLGPLLEDIKQHRTVSLQDDTPLAEVVRTGLPAWLPPVQQWESRYSDVAQAFTRAGYRAAVILPISAHDRTIGAISFGFGEERVLGDDDRAFLLSLTRQCAEALDRASLDESVRQSGARFHAQFLGFPIPTYIWQVSGDDLVVVDYNNAGDAITQQGVRATIGTPHASCSPSTLKSSKTLRGASESERPFDERCITDYQLSAPSVISWSTMCSCRLTWSWFTPTT